MEKHYFIGEGPGAEKLIAATLARHEVATEARRKLMEDYGADGLIESGWNGKKVFGLGFKQKADAPYLKGGERVADGYAYYPKLNTKAGKQLAKRLEDERLEFDTSHFILDALGFVIRTFFEKLKLFEAAAGVTEDLKKILVIIPANEEDPSPAMPEWLREVKESEFLAAQGK